MQAIFYNPRSHYFPRREKQSEKRKEKQAEKCASLDFSPTYIDFSRVIPLQRTQEFSVQSLKDGRE